MNEMNPDKIRDAVRENYAAVAAKGGASCCAPADAKTARSAEQNDAIAARLGYAADELAALPDGANLGVSCGNPGAIAALTPGEVVLDLGSGAGFDCFLAAPKVGPEGRVIGVDMTPEMIAKARDNAAKMNAGNVEFRLGEIEHIPAADNSVDVVISNCVINLSPDQPQVIREAFRVLKPGGRLAISDVVATADFPEEMRADDALRCGCVTGASKESDLIAWMADAGFIDVEITRDDASRGVIKEWAPGRGIEDYVVSAAIEAVKPA